MQTGVIRFQPVPSAVRRTAASTELDKFDRSELTEFLYRLRDEALSDWLQDPPLLPPKYVVRASVRYRTVGPVEFPPLGEEDEQALNSAT